MTKPLFSCIGIFEDLRNIIINEYEHIHCVQKMHWVAVGHLLLIAYLNQKQLTHNDAVVLFLCATGCDVSIEHEYWDDIFQYLQEGMDLSEVSVCGATCFQSSFTLIRLFCHS
jgi:hypothetical protein